MTTEAGTVESDVDVEPRLRATILFVRMWAVAHVIHLVAANGARLDTPWNIAVVGLACAVVLRPRDGRLLAAMMVFQLADYVAEMPISPDHWALIFVVNLAILVTMAVRRSTSTDAIAAAFPAVRVIVLVVYAFAAVSKYNANFLDAATSCANALAATASFGSTGPLHQTLLFPTASIVMETSVPLLLLLPYTRRHWVRVAMAFHFVLSASPAFAVVDFTSALYAAFLLFLSPSEVARILDTMRRAAARSAIVRDARRKPPVTAALAFVVLGFGGYLNAAVAAALVFVAAELYILGVLVATWWAWRGRAERQPLGRMSWFHVPVLLLAVAWALNPYLGLRTTGVFTMFSGLQTEGEHANHLFLPTHHLTAWQDDLVTIESSNDPVLDDAADTELAVPLVALRRMAMSDPDLVVDGTLHGEEVSLGPGADQTHLDPLPAWQAKVFYFRPVRVGDAPFCSIS